MDYEYNMFLEEEKKKGSGRLAKMRDAIVKKLKAIMQWIQVKIQPMMIKFEDQLLKLSNRKFDKHGGGDISRAVKIARGTLKSKREQVVRSSKEIKRLMVEANKYKNIDTEDLNQVNGLKSLNKKIARQREILLAALKDIKEAKDGVKEAMKTAKGQVADKKREQRKTKANERLQNKLNAKMK